MWREEIESAWMDFQTVAALAGEPILDGEINIEYLPAPHRRPTKLPLGRTAVYGFWGDGGWLKIGEAGAKSHGRYASHHYNGHALSTLSGSLSNDPRSRLISGFDTSNPEAWITASTHRFNILLPSTRHPSLRMLLEAFLHARLKPRYEGPKNGTTP